MFLEFDFVAVQPRKPDTGAQASVVQHHLLSADSADSVPSLDGSYRVRQQHIMSHYLSDDLNASRRRSKMLSVRAPILLRQAYQASSSRKIAQMPVARPDVP
jgi:hypothetical protein